MAESRFSLTVTALLCAAVWGAAIFFDHSIWPSLVCLIICTYLMVELNNTNALIRIFSRMVSCTFLALSTMCVFLYPSWIPMFIMLCVIAFYRLSFHCYQNNHSPGHIFHAYLFIGVASIAFVQILYFLPVLWFITIVYLQAFSFRTFIASLLGVITPYWFLIGYDVFFNNIDGFIDHFGQLAVYGPLADFSNLTLVHYISVGFIVLLAVIGTFHFWLTSSNDKIRTRTLYQVFIMMTVATLVFIVLQPQFIEELTGLLIINVSPLAAHFIALTRSKWTNISTIVLMILTLFITIFNLWTFSLNF